jgi:hypothetical protein
MKVATKVSVVPILILVTLFSSGLNINNGDKSGGRPESIEANVYEAFVHGHTTGLGGCSKAVFVQNALLVQKPRGSFNFQPKTSPPPSDLIQHFLSSTPNSKNLTPDSRAFFVPVGKSTLQDIFRNGNFTLDEMKQHKCGWLRFEDEFGKTCGFWKFSRITFNSAANQALFSYRLSMPHWGEDGYAFVELRNGEWTETSVSIGSIT